MNSVARLTSAQFNARLAAISDAENPLLEAARPLLRALADMPMQLSAPTIALLHHLLEQELISFQKLCEHAHIRRDHVVGARYCLCTALDEAAMQTEWGRSEDTGVEWITNGLATRFHEDRHGGDKIYLLVGRLLGDAREHLNLLEVIYRILSLGFEGRYRYEVNGHRKHESIRQRLYDEIATQRGTSAALLLSDVPQLPATRERTHAWRPMLLGGMLAILIVCACFAMYRFRLTTRTAQLQARIAAIDNITTVVRMPAPVSSLRLKQLLANEITAGMLSVDEDDHHSTVTFHGDAMFAPGAIDIHANVRAVIIRVGQETLKVPGQVTVTGFTDSQPIRTRRFASNDALSLARAVQVAQVMQSANVPPARIKTIGLGAAHPIGDNSNAQGRVLNRRVDVTITW
ncbi:type IVB secretion system protein IcmH/DotU [Paraburkholderia caffeinilytica]|uniref:type IVB secretion system protein IcmH/DotU n=1 Tax=Paraburkholderia caffeinilytica TaxID=1761016 RepID=UPI003DA0DEF9